MNCFCGAPLKLVGIDLYSGCLAGHDTLEVLKGMQEQACREAGCELVDACPLDSDGECVMEEVE